MNTRVNPFYFKLICTFLLMSIEHVTYSQVQWAGKVIAASSAYTNIKKPTQYQPEQILGKPNILPSFGASPCAWSPASQNRAFVEWIKVGFDTPMKVQQIAVAESFNPGSISKIFAIDGNNNEHEVYKNKDIKPLNLKGRMFRVFISETIYKVVALKIIMNTAAVPGWNHIDAIGISPSSTPIKANIAIVDNTSDAEIERLPDLINSSYDEIFPVISPDGHTLYFDRKNHPKNSINPTTFAKTQKISDDIWVSTLKDERWSTAIKLPEPLNNEHHNYVCSVTPDGNTLLLGNVYLKNGEAAGGISISKKIKNGWSFPKKVTIDNYSNLNKYSEFNLASNGKVLLLAIERKDSYGDRDLYVSFKKGDGTWSAPKNLGKDINTAATELTPFLAADGYTLYFSSLGYSGYGSADMYVSRRLDDTWIRWSEPQNLGPSINSADWDASYTVEASGEFAYFVSYKNSNNASADIYRARLPKKAKPKPAVIVYGTVYNSKTNEKITAEIVYENLKTGNEVGLASSDPTNAEYKIALPSGENYGFWAKAKGFISLTENIDLTSLSEYAEVKRDLYLTPLEIGQSVRINNIFFVQSQPTLLEESYPELDRIAQTFIDNPFIEVTLQGHSDIGGNPVLNMQLSKERVEVVKTYLVNRGVNEERISTQAFGSTQPLSRKRDPESRRNNRRVEFKITKM